MVKFGAELASRRRVEWERYYLDYDTLKARLKALLLADSAEREEHPARPRAAREERQLVRAGSLGMLPADAVLGSRSTAQAFSQCLDAEVEKIVLFFLSMQGSLAQRVQALGEMMRRDERRMLRAEQGVFGGAGVAAMRQEGAGEADDGNDDHDDDGGGGGGGGGGEVMTVELMEAALLERAQAYREIAGEIIDLVEYVELNVTGLRKILKKHDKVVVNHAIATEYLSSRASRPNSQLLQLYHQEGLSALVGTIRAALSHVHVQLHELRFATASPGTRGEEEDEANFTPLKRALSDIEPVLLDITEAQERVRLSQERTLEDFLSTQSGIGLMIQPRDRRAALVRKTDTLGLWIALMATFLYMTNYYVVAPTSGDYATKLGGTPAFSGVVIGMTPIAALVSCFIYSAWTNSSFKQPLIFSSCMLILGNLLYATALDMSSLNMVLAGRLLTGFGGSRGVIRRYIADHVSRDERTRASAAFVTAGALGMAAGPFLSTLISPIDVAFWNGLVTINPDTSPGWCMALLWLLYMFAIVFLFRDPETESDNTDSVTSEPVPSHMTPRPAMGVVAGAPPRRRTRTTSGAYDPVCSSDDGILYQAAHSGATSVPASPAAGWNAQHVQPPGDATEPASRAVARLLAKSSSSSSSSATSCSSSAPLPVSTTLGSSSQGGRGCAEDMQPLLAGSGAGSLTACTRSPPAGATATARYGALAAAVRSNSPAALSKNGNGLSSNGHGRAHPVSASASSIDEELGSGDGGSGVGAMTSRSGRSSSGASAGGGFNKGREDLLTYHRRPVPVDGSVSGTSIEEDDDMDEEEDDDEDLTLLQGAKSEVTKCWRFLTLPVLVCLVLYFVDKFIMELVVSSAPVLTETKFGWRTQTSGMFMTVLGLLVLPTNLMVGNWSKMMEDRRLMLAIAGAGILSLVVIVNYPGVDYRQSQYLVGATVLFVSMNAYEGVVMSLLSKVVPTQLARGVFNSGLLATEAGTLGRAVADATITMVGVHYMDSMVNMLYVPSLLMLLGCVALSVIYYARLAA